MRLRAIVLALAALFATSSLASAQQQTGEIFGKVTDGSGAVLPGVSVTLTAPNLLQPLTAVTSETGTYQFPRLDIGTYTVKFDLAGFKTVVNQDIIVTVGFRAQVNAQIQWTDRSEHFIVTVFGNNINNVHYYQVHSQSGYGKTVLFNEPRTFGIRAGVKF